MPLPAKRARRPEDCPEILNDLLDYLSGGVENANLRSDAKIKSAKILSAILPNVGVLTVDATEKAIPHGLKTVPRGQPVITMTSAGTVRSSRPPDKSHIYLTADGAGRTCVVKVEA